MGVVQQELEELELSIREDNLLPLVAQDAAVGIEPQPMELPEALIPEIKASVVPLHLSLDERDIDVGSLLRHRVELGQLALDSLEKANFEANQVVVDAHPMAGVFPVLCLDVFALEWAVGRPLWMVQHGSHYMDGVKPVLLNFLRDQV
jgi:hypothetical protein